MNESNIKNNVLLVTIGNTGNESETLRQILESFGFRILRINIGRPNDFIDVLEDKIEFKYEYLIISCHGDQGKIIMDKLDESIYTKNEPKNDFGTDEFNKYLNVRDKIIINTGCTTGYKGLADIITSRKNVYIAPTDYINANSMALFTILFFYNIKKENDIVKAYDLSKSFYKEDFSKITKEEFKDEHRSKKKNC